MADLYAEIGQNARRVKQKMDNTGPELTWLVCVYTGGGAGFAAGTTNEEQLQVVNTLNHQVLQALQQRCEVYEVVRPSTGIMSVQVRANSVPYASGSAEYDGNRNSILEADLVTAGIADVEVWNGEFRDDDINYD